MVIAVFPTYPLSSIKSMTTFELMYGYALQSKYFRLLPSVGIIAGGEVYRTYQVESYDRGGWFSITHYTYHYEKKTLLA